MERQSEVKLADSNYGKVRQANLSDAKSKHRVLEYLSFFQSSYPVQGRGLTIRCMVNREALDYFSVEELEAETLSGIPAHAAQQMREVMEQYDPEREGLLV